MTLFSSLPHAVSSPLLYLSLHFFPSFLSLFLRRVREAGDDSLKVWRQVHQLKAAVFAQAFDRVLRIQTTRLVQHLLRRAIERLLGRVVAHPAEFSIFRVPLRI